MKLITETIESVKYLTEASENGKKCLYIEGPFLVAEQGNRNRRMYRLNTLKREVDRYNEEFIKTKRALGELGHPDTPTINLERVSHLITELRQEGNTFIGKAKILDTPYGQIVKNFIDNGVNLGVSSRGMGGDPVYSGGSVYVPEDYNMICYDAVTNPSVHNAILQRAFQEEVYMLQQATKYKRNAWEVLIDLKQKYGVK